MIPKTRILLCEDDENLGLFLLEYLQVKGLAVDLMTDGEAGLEAFINNKYDLCILDVMMPKKDGFTLAQEIRHMSPEVPIIFLTARTLKEDVLEGFRSGADDYIAKPFSMEELISRMDAIFRRVRGKREKSTTVYNIGKFVFDAQRQLLQIDGRETKLTTKESDLLTLLSNKMNNILTRNSALKTIWTEDNYFNARSMDVYITKLRKLLKDDPEVGILNIHGKGYKLFAPEVPKSNAEEQKKNKVR
jgi:DNA-binding response OmpR family regulator